MTMVATLCFIGASFLLGGAVQIADGFYDRTALAAVAAALLLIIFSTTFRPSGRLQKREATVLHLALCAGIAAQMYALLVSAPGMYVRPTARLELFRAGIAAQALLVACGVLRIRLVRRVWFAGVLALSLLLGAWMIDASPEPAIDVVEVHESALRALERGRNPYRITFRNIYGDTRFYNRDAVAGGRVLFGYPYPPLSLLLASPGHAIFGDYRYSELAAAVASAALMGSTGAALLPRLAAVAWLTTPRIYFVLEQGWTEPIAVLMLALTIWTMRRRPHWTAWSGGLLLVTKQYVALAAPLLWRVGVARPEGPWRFAVRATVAGSLVTLPFLFWNAEAFINTVVLLQTREPFRIDSLSFVSWAARAGWGEASYLWAVGGAIVAVVIALRRMPNSPAGFASGVALASLATFAMGSKAFCNYYFFVIGALCTAVAASGRCQAELDTGATDPPH